MRVVKRVVGNQITSSDKGTGRKKREERDCIRFKCKIMGPSVRRKEYLPEYTQLRTSSQTALLYFGITINKEAKRRFLYRGRKERGRTEKVWHQVVAVENTDGGRIKIPCKNFKSLLGYLTPRSESRNGGSSWDTAL